MLRRSKIMEKERESREIKSYMRAGMEVGGLKVKVQLLFLKQ